MADYKIIYSRKISSIVIFAGISKQSVCSFVFSIKKIRNILFYKKIYLPLQKIK